MSESTKVTKELLVNNYSHRKSGTSIKYIVIHYTGGLYQGSAKRLSKYYHNTTKLKSIHFIVGEDDIIQNVLILHRAWHCGGFSKDNKCDGCNNNAIGIDLVEHKRNTKHISADDKDWYYTSCVLNRGALLVASLMIKYNIDIDHVIRHYDITGKICPRPFVGGDTNDVTGEVHETAWKVFKGICKVWETKIKQGAAESIEFY